MPVPPALIGADGAGAPPVDGWHALTLATRGTGTPSAAGSGVEAPPAAPASVSAPPPGVDPGRYAAVLALRDRFAAMDADGSGTVSFREFRAGMRGEGLLRRGGGDQGGEEEAVAAFLSLDEPVTPMRMRLPPLSLACYVTARTDTKSCTRLAPHAGI